MFLGSTPLQWICKKQNTVENSMYGSEIVAGRLGVEAVLEFCYVLRMLGVPIVGPTRIRKCVVAKIFMLGHDVSSEMNYADICTKALNGPKLHGLCKDLIFSTHEFRGVSELNLTSKVSD